MFSGIKLFIPVSRRAKSFVESRLMKPAEPPVKIVMKSPVKGGRTEEAIRDDIAEAQETLNRINAQLLEAKSYAAETGRYADRDWFNRATTAGKVIGRKIGKLQVELGQLKKLQREKNREEGTTFERQFMYEARELLPRETYEMLFNATKIKIASACKETK